MEGGYSAPSLDYTTDLCVRYQYFTLTLSCVTHVKIDPVFDNTVIIFTTTIIIGLIETS